MPVSQRKLNGRINMVYLYKYLASHGQNSQRDTPRKGPDASAHLLCLGTVEDALATAVYY